MKFAPTVTHGNYLRVRGEYMKMINIRKRRAELPPRARRILPFKVKTNILIGTTSACAENTRIFKLRVTLL